MLHCSLDSTERPLWIHSKLVSNDSEERKYLKVTFLWTQQMRKKTLDSYRFCKHELIEQKRHQPWCYQLLWQAGHPVQQEPAFQERAISIKAAFHAFMTVSPLHLLETKSHCSPSLCVHTNPEGRGSAPAWGLWATITESSSQRTILGNPTPGWQPVTSTSRSSRRLLTPGKAAGCVASDCLRAGISHGALQC